MHVSPIYLDLLDDVSHRLDAQIFLEAYVGIQTDDGFRVF